MTDPPLALYLYSGWLLSFSMDTVKLLHTHQISADEVLTLWGSMEVEDIETHAVYNDTSLIVFKQSWSKANLTDVDWMFCDMYLNSYFYYFQIHLEKIIRELGIKVPCTIQCQVIGLSFMENTESSVYKLALNGEDLIYLHASESEWTAGHNNYSKAVKKIMDKDITTIRSIENILQRQSQKIFNVISVAGKEALTRKAQPKVYISTKSLNLETEIFCMVTGFYPKPINVSLWKDKEHGMENVMFTETLPNGDGNYQITAIVSTRWEEQQNVYCRVEHSSLREPLMIPLYEEHYTVSGLIIGIVLGALICVSGLVWFVKHHKKPRTYTSIAGNTVERISWKTTDANVSI